MVEMTVKLSYNGRNYLTNVIVEKGTSKEQILCMTQEQIKKQWLN